VEAKRDWRNEFSSQGFFVSFGLMPKEKTPFWDFSNRII
jgi:hypothetical protein